MPWHTHWNMLQQELGCLVVIVVCVTFFWRCAALDMSHHRYDCNYNFSTSHNDKDHGLPHIKDPPPIAWEWCNQSHTTHSNGQNPQNLHEHVTNLAETNSNKHHGSECIHICDSLNTKNRVPKMICNRHINKCTHQTPTTNCMGIMQPEPHHIWQQPESTDILHQHVTTLAETNSKKHHGSECM